MSAPSLRQATKNAADPALVKVKPLAHRDSHSGWLEPTSSSSDSA
ncbi:hypothetical protein SynMVIR181_00712 [Synechococcus sp. MVIR-18-1]|nr:hypothetical protein SynMVIR181_00712 [Synechococcus sp. MVIR-18-1]